MRLHPRPADLHGRSPEQLEQRKHRTHRPRCNRDEIRLDFWNTLFSLQSLNVRVSSVLEVEGNRQRQTQSKPKHKETIIQTSKGRGREGGRAGRSEKGISHLCQCKLLARDIWDCPHPQAIIFEFQCLCECLTLVKKRCTHKWSLPLSTSNTRAMVLLSFFFIACNKRVASIAKACARLQKLQRFVITFFCQLFCFPLRSLSSSSESFFFSFNSTLAQKLVVHFEEWCFQSLVDFLVRCILSTLSTPILCTVQLPVYHVGVSVHLQIFQGDCAS